MAIVKYIIILKTNYIKIKYFAISANALEKYNILIGKKKKRNLFIMFNVIVIFSQWLRI